MRSVREARYGIGGASALSSVLELVGRTVLAVGVVDGDGYGAHVEPGACIQEQPGPDGLALVVPVDVQGIAAEGLRLVGRDGGPRVIGFGDDEAGYAASDIDAVCLGRQAVVAEIERRARCESRILEVPL